ncbi:iron-sulfur binding domain-containing protein [Alcanivorax hongdengensis A-11-3]|uniref:Iron-sulfur binding domain-containing protein n=1 Tax=Alcanivorax hongdengensis A-11-3 TaxID=1177179 RepID=L0W7T4_9GAMM|nr:DsrE family protein [Alcanivorax hongdengensis]EKF73014.1 iron-sulfur binding domain-containing protein [Alcanivorax hongdengensis A-11-3]
MNDRKTLTFAFMDPPFESERTVTFFRLLDAALEKDTHVRVFAYEGAVALAFAKQSPHGNAVHGRNTEEEAHPLTKDWIVALQQKARTKGLNFEWINCGLCVDERGVNDVIEDCGRGGPPDLWRYASQSFNTLTIGTR